MKRNDAFIIAHASEWLEKKTVPQLIKIREQFYKEEKSECTCDYCVSALFCSLAYDRYNTGGDCLYEK